MNYSRLLGRFRLDDRILHCLLAPFILIKVFHLQEFALKNAGLNGIQIGLNADSYVAFERHEAINYEIFYRLQIKLIYVIS